MPPLQVPARNCVMPSLPVTGRGPRSRCHGRAPWPVATCLHRRCSMRARRPSGRSSVLTPPRTWPITARLRRYSHAPRRCCAPRYCQCLAHLKDGIKFHRKVDGATLMQEQGGKGETEGWGKDRWWVSSTRRGWCSLGLGWRWAEVPIGCQRRRICWIGKLLRSMLRFRGELKPKPTPSTDLTKNQNRYRTEK